MADTNQRLTRYDQVLVNALMSLVLPVITDAANDTQNLAIVARVLPRVSRGHHYIGELADWSDSLIGAGRDRGAVYCRAEFQIKQSLAKLTTWRLAHLMDDLRAENQTNKENAA